MEKPDSKFAGQIPGRHVRIRVSLTGCAKTVRKIRQGRLRLDTDLRLRARRRTQVLDRFIVPSHMYGCECQFDRRMGIGGAYPGMCKARLEVPVHSSAQASPVAKFAR